ncbi:acyl-CoA dehydrogenase family protein [Rhodococcoides corynebacterioides]|uniref:acyl-CoA dehydrogenase family protein n=1 Tax=Rhodococcoides corynebacterioides TaxID=53972 RepID=UPI001C9B862D|nr:acyl-CoA dehydrogenase family protein [Rhodococcus corynebacterioides]MBY6351826.1 acyl-CoA dehydrogenase family protein [Rhodococcus corynebacterioides]MBY6364848.1 acyl-CoA dehydrogenase family protein [Rhodococcus corynebacterioides]
MTPTHTVTNQVPPLVDYDVADQPVLLEALHREGAGDAEAELHRVGRLAGSARAQRWGELAEAHPPVLHTHDRYGNRVDEVIYDPAYHELMGTAVDLGLHGAPWADPSPHAHLVRAATSSVWSVVDAGHGCPISMTYAVVPALRANPDLAAQYEPLLTTRVYDPTFRPPLEKGGLIAGMSMTEKQGGSDVRANTTTAVPRPDGTWSLTGHKWFTSAPMSDILLVLAQSENGQAGGRSGNHGLSCFLLPRILPDGTRNAMAIQRLKDKLGNHSNASSEVEYDGATAWLLGEEGRGVRTIIEMVNMTRLDCTLGSATGMRDATARAIHHATHRAAFGKQLVDQPAMRNVLADLAVESEASTTVALWLAALTDRAAAGDERAALLRRIGLAVSKYYVCKRGPAHAAEALECLGGNGYAEESGMPKLYREAPLLSIWEGSGNVAALDTLRAVARQPETLTVLFDELDSAAGADDALDAAVRRVKSAFTDIATLEHRARRVVGDLALALQGSLLVRHGHPAVADAFTATRLGGDWGTVFGTLPTGVDTAAIIARNTPKVGA